ncbi:MAG: right-handed parallel beta-helix repeat-containing protein [Phycisphaerales bacterium]|nr:right-handed parallel beta-helix repeat-containing protein [Phycisphaerales bacterium]
MRCVIILATVLLCGALSAAVHADGRTFYVRQGGSDRNSGLDPDAALRSIQRAVSLCTRSGDSVIVGPGVYYEQVRIGSGAGAAAASGTAESPNALVADLHGSETGDEAGAVVIEGDGVRECGIRLTDRDDWLISGFTFRGQSQRGVLISQASGVSVEACMFHALREAGVEATDCDELIIAGNLFLRDAQSGSSIVVRAESRAKPKRADERHHDKEDDVEREAHRENDARGRDNARDGYDRDDDDRHDPRPEPPDRGHKWGHHKRRRSDPGETVIVEANRFTITGADYLASGFAASKQGSRHRHGEKHVGIDVHVVGEGAVAHVLNNVGSDCSTGIDLRVEGEGCSGVVANNTLAGCWLGIRASARRGEMLVSDNVVVYSRFALAAPPRGSSMEISGLLTFEVAGNLLQGGSEASILGHVADADPMFAAAAAGDFRLQRGSPAIDAGRGAAGVLSDLNASMRPLDGDGDGDAQPDLGACEYDPDQDGVRRLHLVQWREIERLQP